MGQQNQHLDAFLDHVLHLLKLLVVVASGVGVLLIEQFATVALALATGVHVMEGGVLRYSGTAAELKERPELKNRHFFILVTNEDGDEIVRLPLEVIH